MESSNFGHHTEAAGINGFNYLQVIGSIPLLRGARIGFELAKINLPALFVPHL